MSISSENKTGNVARIVDRLSKNKDVTSLSNNSFLQKSDVSFRRNQVPANGRNRFIARFSYSPQQPDELTLNEGDELEFIENVEDGWARGMLHTSGPFKGKTGLYPTNFVAPVQIDSMVITNLPAVINAETNNSSLASTATNDDTLQIGKSEELSKTQPINNNKDKERESDGIIQTSNVLPSTFRSNRRVVSSVITGSTDALPACNLPLNSSPNTKQIEQAKVLFAYEAAHPDELSLPEGAMVSVLDRNTDDEGWWFGEYNGARGLFPENFVKLIPSQSESISEKLPTSIGASPPTLPTKPSKFLSGPLSSNISPNAQLANKLSPTSAVTPIPMTGVADKTKSVSVATRSSSSAIHEERKSVVAGLQSKLFPSGKLPIQRPIQSKLGSSPEHHEIAVEPKLKLQDDPNANKLVSLVKSRVKVPTKRLPSNKNYTSFTTADENGKGTSIDTPSVKVEPEILMSIGQLPSSSSSNKESKPEQQTNTISAQIKYPNLPSIKSNDGPVSNANISVKLNSFDDAAEVKQTIGLETDIITREEFNRYKSEVDEKLADMHRIITEMKKSKK